MLLESRGQLSFEADLFAVDDVVLEPLFDSLALRRLLGTLCLDALKQRGELGQGIVDANIAFELALVVDQFARHFQLLLTDTIERLDLAGVDDRRIESGFDS